MSFLPYDDALGYSPAADDPIGQGNLAARQHGQAEDPAAWRSEAKCRRCSATECRFCQTPVRAEPSNVPVPLCHVCHEKAYGATESDPFSGEPLPTLPTCQRRTLARIGA